MKHEYIYIVAIC